MPKLLLFLQDGGAREVLFDKDRITIGRRSDNDVSLPYPSVSGRHAVISYLSASKCFVEDLKSTNGTLLNGSSIFERRQLKDRDQIDIGGQKFVFLEGVKAAEAEAEEAVPTLSISASYEYLGARPTVPMDGPPQIQEEDIDDDYSGLHFPTIFRSGSGEKPRVPKKREPGPLPTVDAAMVPSPAEDDTLPTDITPVMPPVGVIEAMSGPSEKRKLLLYTGGDYVLGRPGLQLAVVRVNDEGCRLLPMGDAPLAIHGATLPPEGVLLADKDTFTVGRSLLRFHRGAPSE